MAHREPNGGLKKINTRKLLELLVARQRHVQEPMETHELQTRAEEALARLIASVDALDKARAVSMAAAAAEGDDR